MNTLDTSHIPDFPAQIAIGWSEIQSGLSAHVLSKKDRLRLDSMINDRRKSEFLSARHTFWSLIDELGWDHEYVTLEKEELGKPYIELKGKRAFISFSHTKNLVFCAISKTLDLGLDAESIDRKVNPAIVKRILSENEWDIYGEEDPIALWTMKEAAVKSLGTGLRTNLKDIELRKFKGSKFLIGLGTEKKLQGHCFTALKHCISIAY
ncbi:MAG: 4'-phosphopantetheinyl transferase superfamily protein [Balneola sp.]|nr:MAG: 4'-phosphopantetheinyl transferase superfamily protein [Balneola sp.]